MSRPDHEAEMQLLRRLAEAVDRVVTETPQAEFGHDGGMGASGLRASRIDRLAEDEIVRLVDASDLEINILSEEAGFLDRDAERTLIVDPVDGTMNAVRGIPFYCVSLAITPDELGGVDIGLVRNLCTDDVYEATLGGGARLNGEPIRAAPFEPGHAVRSPVAKRDVLPALGELVEETRYVRGLGAAALEMSLVGQGAMDLYVHLSRGLRIVDIAAATLIVREAGGVVVTPDGVPPELPLEVGARTNLLAAGDPVVLDRLGVLA